MVNKLFNTAILLTHTALKDAEARSLIRQQTICFAGNSKLKIYGKLNCASGKRLLRKNRVFFVSETEARKNNFRPCGNCMPQAYKNYKMDLFSDQKIESLNLLPNDGTVFYYGRILPALLADDYLNALLQNIEWKNDEAVIFGKRIITKRKVAWYGDQPFDYTYSKGTKRALPWTPLLKTIRALAEEYSGDTFNSCLLNLYHNGNEGMAWHSDAEKELKKNGAIASLSFGAERRFLFRHKDTKETVAVQLEHGSLLVMKDETQTNWLHRLPTTKTVQHPRINLTFRTIVSG